MYKVLIIDDEVLVRVGLKTTIDWEANGFTVVAEASNGEQGYEQYRKHMPDVIITDIKMPKKDGLWLVEEVRKADQHVKILVLTCYDDFAYARKALKIGADDYILKSEVEDEELVAVMQSIRKKIDVQNKAKHVKEKDLKSINDIKRSIFVDMIKSDFAIDTQLADRCSSIGFPLTGTRFAFASVSISSSHGISQDNPTSQTGNAVLNILLDQLAERTLDYIYVHQSSRYAMLLSAQTLKVTELNRMLHSVSHSAKQYFDCFLNVVYTDCFDDISKAAGIYRDFADKEQVLFYKGQDSCYISNTDSIRFSEPNIFQLKKEHNKKFIEAIGAESINGTKELVRQLGCWFEQNNVNPRLVKIFYSSLMGDVFSSYGLFLESNKIFSNHKDYHFQIENAESLQSIVNLLCDFTEKVIGEIKQMRYASSKVLINRALNFIQYHYDEKISLDDVAEKLHLSKHYLCNAFKKATGENMSLYINKLRIEKAKRLLLDSDGRVKEIFEEVGYSNQQYFSKVFKKITGMTVMEYKESMTAKK